MAVYVPLASSRKAISSRTIMDAVLLRILSAPPGRASMIDPFG